MYHHLLALYGKTIKHVVSDSVFIISFGVEQHGWNK